MFSLFAAFSQESDTKALFEKFNTSRTSKANTLDSGVDTDKEFRCAELYACMLNILIDFIEGAPARILRTSQEHIVSVFYLMWMKKENNPTSHNSFM